MCAIEGDDARYAEVYCSRDEDWSDRKSDEVAVLCVSLKYYVATAVDASLT